MTNVVSGKIGPMMEHTDFGYVKASQVIEYDPEAEKLLPVTNGDLKIMSNGIPRNEILKRSGIAQP